MFSFVNLHPYFSNTFSSVFAAPFILGSRFNDRYHFCSSIYENDIEKIDLIDLISQVFSLVLLLVSAASFALGVYVLSNNPRDSLNRSFFILAMFASYWVLFTVFRYLTYSLTEVKFWFHVIFLWPFVIVALMRFVLVICQSEDILRQLSVKVILYIPASFFSLYWLFGNMDQYLLRKDWGWEVNVSTFHPISLLIALWTISLTVISIRYALQYYSSIENNITLQQTKWVLTASGITIVGAILSEVIFRTFEINFPPLTSIAFGVTCIFISYAMLKYRLFLLNPETAARNILSQMTESVFLLDLDGKIRFANTAALELLDYSQMDLIGKNISSLISGHQGGQPSISNLIEKGLLEQHQDLEGEFLDKSGKVIPVTISNSFIKSGNEVRGMVWLSKDITNQKQLEEEQRKIELVRRELEQRRLNFITMSSHELRTPLTAIIGYTEFLEKVYATNYDKETITDYLSIIKKNAQRLDRLTRGMMDISQIDGQKFRIKKEKVNFLDFFNETFSIYKTRLKERLTLNIPNGTNPIYLNMDSDRINQVLVNVMDNAIKNSTPDQLYIAVKLREVDKSIKLSISDQGPGIKAEDLEPIFDKFVSIPTKNSVIGSGIGLYVARMIIKAHGGTITAESEGLDKGATFHISLPI